MQSNTKNQNSCEILYANVKISGFVAVLGQPARKRSKTSKATGKKKSNDILTLDFDIFGTNKKRGKKKKENEYDPFEGLY